MVQRKVLEGSAGAALDNFTFNGATLPSVDLTEETPLTRVNINDICKNKKILLFGVLGAYIPGCSSTHLSKYLSRSTELKRKGYNEIICITVNDIFVTQAWGRENRVEGKVRMLSDPNAEFAKATGLDVYFPTFGIRCKGFAMIVINNVVKQIVIEPDDTSAICLVNEKLVF